MDRGCHPAAVVAAELEGLEANRHFAPAETQKSADLKDDGRDLAVPADDDLIDVANHLPGTVPDRRADQPARAGRLPVRAVPLGGRGQLRVWADFQPWRR